MTAIGLKWAVRRYSPTPYTALGEDGAKPLTPQGHREQIFDTWRDVCIAADTILGSNALQMGVQPSDPLVIQHGEDVVLIYTKLEI
jgi:hypothetical protein